MMLHMTIFRLVCVANFMIAGLNARLSNGTNDVMLSNLLELHENFCGNESIDNFNISLLESGMTLFPMPCCIPCTCEPDLTSLRGCCPVRLLRGQDRLEMRRGGKEQEARNGTDQPDTTTIPQDDLRDKGFSATPILNDEDIPEYVENEGVVDLEDIPEYNESRVIVNDEDIPEYADKGVVNDEDIPQYANKEDVVIKNTELRTETLCIRPQAFYRPNFFLDSKAYEMIASCPVSFVNGSTKSKCQAGFENTNIIDMIPVTSSITGITYVNKHCFLCNEDADESSLHFWQPAFAYQYNFYVSKFYESPHSIISVFQRKNAHNANIHFLPSVQTVTQECYTFDIATCNQTGLWHVYDEQVKSLCDSSLSLAIIYSINGDRKLFKNIACLHCNVDGNVLKKQCGYLSKTVKRSEYSIRVNVESLVQNQENERKDDISESYLDHSTLTHFTSPLCPAGYVHVMNLCRPVCCPRDHVMNDGHCKPLFDILTGLYLHFKLQIIVDQPVSNALRPEFADALKYVFSQTAKRTISLQTLEKLNLWYLPRSNKNPAEYYLFEVYLFNSSSEIQYNKAVREIYTFIQLIKTVRSLTFKNGKIVRLTYQFGHQVKTDRRGILLDITNAFPLRLLVEKHRKPDLSMTISNTNWCYRTILASNEVVYYGNILRIKGSEVIIYEDQFDSGDWFYLCIDVFSDIDGNKEKHPVNTTEIITISDKNFEDSDEIPWYFTRTSAMTFFLICIVVLSIVFYKRWRQFCVGSADLDQMLHSVAADEGGVSSACQ